jgi:MoaA/NifB/PqqE/SkfB family radical SAM enzyme
MATACYRAHVEDGLGSVWLELTGRCQLSCTHCYAASGPNGTHGSMTVEDWKRVIDEAAFMGTRMVQFIGGEPTLYPALPALVRYAVARGLEVEVYSNLVRVPEAVWATFGLPGVSLATSYYSAMSEAHDRITRRRSHARTRAGIRDAVRRGVPIRVGVVQVEDGQGIEEACADVRALGVEDVRVDRLREVGRGVRAAGPGVDQLCGQCASGRLAVSADGDVWPCVFSRWLVVGNARRSSLADINGGVTTAAVRRTLTEHFAARPGPRALCEPDRDKNGGCQPLCDPVLKCDPDKDDKK